MLATPKLSLGKCQCSIWHHQTIHNACLLTTTIDNKPPQSSTTNHHHHVITVTNSRHHHQPLTTTNDDNNNMAMPTSPAKRACTQRHGTSTMPHQWTRHAHTWTQRQGRPRHCCQWLPPTTITGCPQQQQWTSSTTKGDAACKRQVEMCHIVQCPHMQVGHHVPLPFSLSHRFAGHTSLWAMWQPYHQPNNQHEHDHHHEYDH